MFKKILLGLFLAILGLGLWQYRNNVGLQAQQADTLYGNVDIREVSIAFRVGGRVSEISVDEGAEIKVGAVLARLDSEPLQNNVHQAEAQLAGVQARNAMLHSGYRKEDVQQARAKLQAAQVAALEAKRQWQRQQALMPEAATTRRALDESQSRHEQAQANVLALQEQLRLLRKGFRAEEIAESDAQLQQAQANLAGAKLALADSVLTAPSSGIILTRAIEVGSMVQAGSSAFTLSLTEPVWVRAYVAEPQLGRFNSGTQVTLSTDSRPQQPYHGIVGFVAPTAEFTPKNVETADLRTALVYRLRIVVNDPDRQLRQGMPVTVKLKND